MTTLNGRPNSALLVIDVQNDVMTATHNRDGVIANIASLVDKARTEDVPVIWVQHNDDNLPKGSPGWEYVSELKQDEAESVVHKHWGDSFEETDLEAVLAKLKVGHLFVTGAQTDACVRSTLHGRSSGATTPRWSATRTPLRTAKSGALPRPTRSSTTPTSTGRTTPRRGGKQER